MAQTLYFYDLETSGFNPRSARIMQFAGQRTDLKLKPIGEPHNFFIKLSEDVLPSPDAILVTGITPQKTLSEGVTEAEFLEIFNKEIAKPGTIFCGFNTVRFDDEFMRFLNYRNFYDAYEWQWKDNRGRWDLLDVVRMTRALRPEGIKWPVDSTGTATNRLELLTSINKLDHQEAHDALSDVKATIAVARLLRAKQPKLFDYLLKMRDKKTVSELVNAKQPFVYTSGKYPSEYEKTTVAIKLTDHPKSQGALVYDLRVDPAPFIDLPPEKLADAWVYKKDSNEPRLPVKTLQFNRVPAVAPLGVLDDESQKRLQIDMEVITKNQKALRANAQFISNLLKAVELLDKKQQARLLANPQEVDERLYDGFFDDSDRKNFEKLRQSMPDGDVKIKFKDDRLNQLLPLFKARNYPKSLNADERKQWEDYKAKKLVTQLPGYMTRLQELAATAKDKNQQYILEELNLYAQSIMPAPE